MAKFFYDQQIRRFLVQFARIFSDWNVTKGKDPNGNDIIIRVPIQYGDSSRQASTILANNSASSMPSAPLITYYISGLEYDQKRTQDPYFLDKVNVRQRSYNSDTQQFETSQGQAFTVERIMPVPYTLRVTVDFWTTNYNQKLELIEQLGVLFNPAMEIQSTDNFIDWTSLSVVYQDGLTFSSRTVPQGTGNPIDIMTWKFYMPIWLSSSVKIKKLGVIHKIIASIFQGNALTDMQDDHLLIGTREKITPYGYKILLVGNTLQILPANEVFNPRNEGSLDTPNSPDTSGPYWTSVLNVYGTVRPDGSQPWTQGTVRPGISQIWLQNPYLETEIVGTIALNPSDDRLLIYDIDPDTLPRNTLDAVNSVINPLVKSPIQVWREINNISDNIPDSSITIPAGTRFLLVENIGDMNNTDPSIAWGSVVANANDIIEYDGTQWLVSFDSQILTSTQFVTNLRSGVQYRYADGVWMKAYEGWYDQGDYSIVI